jgi:Holliday junction resolvase RusA-like endonuclease
MSLWTGRDGKERAKYGDEVVRHRNLMVGGLSATWAGEPPLLGPIAVRVSAQFARPASHYLPANSRRAEPVLRQDAPTWWTGYPDGDKILRMVNDALTIAGVVKDDALVAVARVEKLFADDSGTAIEVWTLDDVG